MPLIIWTFLFVLFAGNGTQFGRQDQSIAEESHQVKFTKQSGSTTID